MNVQKIKAAAYSVYLNACRYKVLKNNKNIPSTTVRAIRHHQGIDPDTLDTFESYKRITKDFSQPKPKKTEEYLFRDNFAFFNKETKKIDYKKQVKYSKLTENQNNIHTKKNFVDDELLEKRDLKNLKKKKYTKREERVDMSKAFLGYVSSKTVVIRKSLAEVETEKYYDKLTRKKEQESSNSFISTLINNLFKNK